MSTLPIEDSLLHKFSCLVGRLKFLNKLEFEYRTCKQNSLLTPCMINLRHSWKIAPVFDTPLYINIINIF